MDRDLILRAEEVGRRMAAATNALFSADIQALASDSAAQSALTTSFYRHISEMLQRVRKDPQVQELLAEKRISTLGKDRPTTMLSDLIDSVRKRDSEKSNDEAFPGSGDYL